MFLDIGERGAAWGGGSHFVLVFFFFSYIFSYDESQGGRLFVKICLSRQYWETLKDDLLL